MNQLKPCPFCEGTRKEQKMEDRKYIEDWERPYFAKSAKPRYAIGDWETDYPPTDEEETRGKLLPRWMYDTNEGWYDL